MVALRKIDTLITIGKRAEKIADQAQKDGTSAEVHTFKRGSRRFRIIETKARCGHDSFN